MSTYHRNTRKRVYSINGVRVHMVPWRARAWNEGRTSKHDLWNMLVDQLNSTAGQITMMRALKLPEYADKLEGHRAREVFDT